MKNEMTSAENLLNRLDRNEIIRKDSSIYPYIYTKADNGLIVNPVKYDRYDTDELAAQQMVLRMYLIETLESEDHKTKKKSFRLARGMMKRLGMSYSRLHQIWDDAPEYMIESLNAHQIFFKKVEEAYNEIIIDGEYMPLIKNHGGGTVENGSDISKKMRAHTHRNAIQMLRSLRRNYHEH